MELKDQISSKLAFMPTFLRLQFSVYTSWQKVFSFYFLINRRLTINRKRRNP